MFTRGFFWHWSPPLGGGAYSLTAGVASGGGGIFGLDGVQSLTAEREGNLGKDEP